MVPPHPLHHPHATPADARLAPQARPSTPAAGFHDPRPHPLLEPEVKVACPACNLPVGARRGQLNKHRVRSPRGDDPNHVAQDGVKASPLGPDGWCIGKAP